MLPRAEAGVTAERLWAIESAGIVKPHWTLNDYREELESPLAELWFWTGGEGFVLYRPDGAEAWITQTAVAQKGRGQGSKLLVDFIEYLKAETFTSVALEVSHRNAPALRVYEKCGLGRIGERKAYYRNGDDAIVMRRTF